MTNETHNGWTNYETWLVALWIGNEQGSQEMCDEWATECLQEAIDDDESDVRASAYTLLADRLESMHDEAKDEMVGVTGVFADLLNGALGRVDWREIARHYIDEVTIYSAGWNMPGFGPDNAPSLFIDADDARSYIADAIESAVEDDAGESQEGDGSDEDAAYAAAQPSIVACRNGSGEFGETVGRYHYFVTAL